jgi:predicted ribosomally synthesized peptide with nif11-like leader
MSVVAAKKLVTRLKDDEAFRKAIRSMDHGRAWDLVKQEGYDCSEEEIKRVHDNFG